MRLDPFPLFNVVQKTVHFSLITKNRFFYNIVKGGMGDRLASVPTILSETVAASLLAVLRKGPFPGSVIGANLVPRSLFTLKCETW